MEKAGIHRAKRIKLQDLFELNLEDKATVIGEKYRMTYNFERLLSEAAGIDLQSLRRLNSKQENLSLWSLFSKPTGSVLKPRGRTSKGGFRPRRFIP